MSDEPSEAPANDEPPTSSVFMSLMVNDVEDEFHDVVAKIQVCYKIVPSLVDDSLDPVIEVRLFGAETDRIFHLMLDAYEAQNLALRLAHRAGVAIEESQSRRDP